MLHPNRLSASARRPLGWMLSILCVWLALHGLAGAVPAVQAADDAPISADRRVPRNPFFFASIRNVAELKERLPETLLGQIGQDESLRGFVSQVREKLDEISQEFEGEAGVSLSGLFEALQGEIAVVSYKATDEGHDFSGVMLIDFGEHEATIQKLLEKSDEQSEKRGGKRDEEEFDGTRIITYAYPKPEPDEEDEDDEESSAPEPTCYCLRDTFLVIGNSKTAIKDVLNRWDGTDEDILAENPVYTTIREQVQNSDQPGQPLVFWYVDPLGIAKSAATKAGPVQSGMFFGTLPKLGLDKFRGVGGSFDLATGEFDNVHRILLSLEPDAGGVFGALEFPEVSHTPPAWVKNDVAQYLSANWNLPKALQTIEALVDQFQGPGTFANLMHQAMQGPAGLQLHPKKDLLDHFTGRFHFVSYPLPARKPAARPAGEDEDSEPEPTQDVLVAWELSNPAAFKVSLTKIAQLAGFPGKVREFQGETIYEFPAAVILEEDEETGEARPAAGPPAPAKGIVITERHFMFATNVRHLEDVLRGGKPGETLAESAAWRQVAQHFPSTSSLVSFQKGNDQWETIYNLFRTGLLNDAFSNKVDFSTLPPFETIRHYLTPSGTYARPTPHGAEIISFTLGREK